VKAGKPELDTGSMLIMQCFDDTSTMRAGGMGLMPVPYDAVVFWARQRRMTFPQQERLWTVVKIVDAKIRVILRERAQEEAKR
jgi:hypothetical protein